MKSRRNGLRNLFALTLLLNLGVVGVWADDSPFSAVYFTNQPYRMAAKSPSGSSSTMRALRPRMCRSRTLRWSMAPSPMWPLRCDRRQRGSVLGVSAPGPRHALRHLRLQLERPPLERWIRAGWHILCASREQQCLRRRRLVPDSRDGVKLAPAPAAPAPAAPAARRFDNSKDDPTKAAVVDGKPVTLAPRSVMWFRFEYLATDTEAHPNRSILLQNVYGNQNLKFELYAPERLNRWWENDPTGDGTKTVGRTT